MSMKVPYIKQQKHGHNFHLYANTYMCYPSIYSTVKLACKIKVTAAYRVLQKECLPEPFTSCVHEAATDP
jgi:hypothetical protein